MVEASRRSEPVDESIEDAVEDGGGSFWYSPPGSEGDAVGPGGGVFGPAMEPRTASRSGAVILSVSTLLVYDCRKLLTEPSGGAGRAAQIRDQKLWAIADLPRSSVAGGESASSCREASLARVPGREAERCWTGLYPEAVLVGWGDARRLRVASRSPWSTQTPTSRRISPLRGVWRRSRQEMAGPSCGSREMRWSSLMCQEIMRAAVAMAILERRVASAAAKRAALNFLRTFQGLAPRPGWAQRAVRAAANSGLSATHCGIREAERGRLVESPWNEKRTGRRSEKKERVAEWGR